MKYRTETIGELTTTFTGDFDIAELFGSKAIQDTFERSFKGWKSQIDYMTNLAIVVNNKAWEHARTNREYAALYSNLYYVVRDWVYSEEAKFSQAALDYYFRMTD